MRVLAALGAGAFAEAGMGGQERIACAGSQARAGCSGSRSRGHRAHVRETQAECARAGRLDLHCVAEPRERCRRSELGGHAGVARRCMATMLPFSHQRHSARGSATRTGTDSAARSDSSHPAQQCGRTTSCWRGVSTLICNAWRRRLARRSSAGLLRVGLGDRMSWNSVWRRSCTHECSVAPALGLDQASAFTLAEHSFFWRSLSRQGAPPIACRVLRGMYSRAIVRIALLDTVGPGFATNKPASGSVWAVLYEPASARIPRMQKTQLLLLTDHARLCWERIRDELDPLLRDVATPDAARFHNFPLRVPCLGLRSRSRGSRSASDWIRSLPAGLSLRILRGTLHGLSVLRHWLTLLPPTWALKVAEWRWRARLLAAPTNDVLEVCIPQERYL